MAYRSRRSSLPPGLAPVLGVMALVGVGLYLQEIGFFERHAADPLQNNPGPLINSPNSAAVTPASAIEPAAAQLLRDMRQAYRQSGEFEEEWEFSLAYRENNQPFEFKGQISVKRAADGHARLRCQQDDRLLELFWNEQHGIARVIQPATHDLDHQVSRRSFANSATLADLFALTQIVDPARPEVQRSLLGDVSVPLAVSPLAMFLADPGWDTFVRELRSAKLLPTAAVGNEPVHVLQLDSPAGTFVLSIDRMTYRCHSIDFPPPAELVGRAEQINARLVRRTQNAATEPVPALAAVDDELRAHPETKFVRYFVVPFVEIATPFLGHRVDKLSFTGLDGGRVEESAWKGAVTVFCWFADHETSRLVIQEIEEALAKVASRDIVWLPVAVDSPTVVPDDHLLRLRNTWSISGRVVRDLEAVGRDRLGVQRSPTSVVLDKEGVVQLIEEGGGPELDRALETVLQRCLANEPLAQRYLQMIEEGQRLYAEALAAAKEGPVHP